MRFSESPKPIQAYCAFAELTLDSFRRVWNDWFPAFESFNAMHPEAGGKLSGLMQKLDQRRYVVTSAKTRSVAVFVKNRGAIFEELYDALAMIELMDDFAQTASALTKSWIAMTPTRLATLRESCASLELSVSNLNLTHATMSEHTHAVADEYALIQPTHPQLAELHKVFFSELFATRDIYFSNASLENLQRYIAVAQELVEKEHPLQAYAHTSPFVKYDEGASARAVSLLDELMHDELMVGLLTDCEELSHAE
jgi:hypothetical protein